MKAIFRVRYLSMPELFTYSSLSLFLGQSKFERAGPGHNPGAPNRMENPSHKQLSDRLQQKYPAKCDGARIRRNDRPFCSGVWGWTFKSFKIILADWPALLHLQMRRSVQMILRRPSVPFRANRDFFAFLFSFPSSGASLASGRPGAESRLASTAPVPGIERRIPRIKSCVPRIEARVRCIKRRVRHIVRCVHAAKQGVRGMAGRQTALPWRHASVCNFAVMLPHILPRQMTRPSPSVSMRRACLCPTASQSTSLPSCASATSLSLKAPHLPLASSRMRDACHGAGDCTRLSRSKRTASAKTL
jgi:hypothetical protein